MKTYLYKGNKDMFLTEGSNLTRMKNKYLTRSLCITVLAAMVLNGPLSVSAGDDSELVQSVDEEGKSEEKSSAEENTPEQPEPTAAPVTPEPTPEPEVPQPEPTVAPDIPEPTIGPVTPTPESEQPDLTPTVTPEPDAVEISEAVRSLISKIDALSEKELTAEDKSAVEELRAEYESLQEEQKCYVTNYQLLLDFEETLRAMADDTSETETDEEQKEDQNVPETDETEDEVEISDESDDAVGKMGTPVYYVSNLHAGKEFYLDSLKENYQISFSDDFASVMDQIEQEYKERKGLTDGSDDRENGITTSADSLLVRNWQDILAVYIYEQMQTGMTEFVMDASSKTKLAGIFEEMNPIIHDEENTAHASYGNYHINYYIKQHGISQEDRETLKKYVETDCKLLCAIVTDARGFVRQSVGDDVSEERVNVITAAYSLVGEVGYFWGGKSTQIGKDSSWGSAAKVEAEGSASTGTVRAYGLDCSGFVTWSVINGYMDPGVQNAVGDGTSEQWENARVISEADAQPGDLVFQDGPEAGSDNHVGIICGKTDDGDWIAVHCSSGKNGVTVGEAYGASFRYIRQPSFYPTQEEFTQMANAGSKTDNVQEAADDTFTLLEVSGEDTVSDILADNVSLDESETSDEPVFEDTDETEFTDEAEVIFEDEEEPETVDISGSVETTGTLNVILDQNVSVAESDRVIFPQKADDDTVEIIFED